MNMKSHCSVRCLRRRMAFLIVVLVASIMTAMMPSSSSSWTRSSTNSVCFFPLASATDESLDSLISPNEKDRCQQDADCLNGGQCVIDPSRNDTKIEEEGDYVPNFCSCAKGFTGDLCDEHSCPCKHGGTCKPIDDVTHSNDATYTCDCVNTSTVYYKGRHCGIVVNICPDGSECYHGGNCVGSEFDGDESTYHCDCPHKYTGPQCKVAANATDGGGTTTDGASGGGGGEGNSGGSSNSNSNNSASSSTAARPKGVSSEGKVVISMVVVALLGLLLMAFVICKTRTDREVVRFAPVGGPNHGKAVVTSAQDGDDGDAGDGGIVGNGDGGGEARTKVQDDENELI